MPKVRGGRRGGGGGGSQRGGGGGGRGGGGGKKRPPKGPLGAAYEVELLELDLMRLMREIEAGERRATAGETPNWPLAMALRRARWAIEEALGLLRAARRQ